MPELPEVETVRDGLARHLVGRTIVGVEHLAPRAMRRQAGGAAEFVDSLIGATPRAVVRRGKFAWVIFDDVSLALVVHLGMSGQMLVRDPSRSLECRIAIFEPDCDCRTAEASISSINAHLAISW